MPTDTSQYDFFIAHPGPDSSTAEALYDVLSGAAKVFLDSRSLEIACDWDLELSKAQRQSFITVVLVSSRTDAAYYERVEVASAIRLARAEPARYRVVPIALDDMPEPQVDPYGLNLKHGLSLSKAGSLENIAFRLLDTLHRSKYRTVLFDPREGGVANNFRGRAGAFYKGKGTEARQISPIGEGTLQIDPFGVLTITRTTSEGRFEIYPTGAGLKAVGNKRIFHRKDSGTADRAIWIHCEARSAFGKQGLRFVLKNDPKDTWLGSEKRIVESSDWAPVDVYLHINPSLEFFVRIDHEEVSRVPSELQIRWIIIREKDAD
jgi:hypothetical protein